jgi:enediyne biosynthesis protein E4
VVEGKGRDSTRFFQILTTVYSNIADKLFFEGSDASLFSKFLDIDGDGDLDLLVLSTSKIELFENDGNASFSEVGAVALVDDFEDSTSASFSDIDNDGKLDLYVTNYTSEKNRFFKNLGSGTFENIATTKNVLGLGKSMGSLLADFDNDGDIDILVLNLDGPDHLFEADGKGNFTDVTKYVGILDDTPSTSATFGDYDRDGDLDLFVTNTNGVSNRFFRADQHSVDIAL